MAGSPMTGGQTQKANPMDQGRYVGNPNHIAQQQLIKNNPNILDAQLNTTASMIPSPMPMPSAPMNINTMAAQGIRGAGMGTAMGMGYRPQQVSTVGQSATVTPQTLASTNLDTYMNPYTDAVIKQNEADILRGAQIGLNELSAQAQAAGSFGGSRHGIQGAELGRGSLEQLARSSSGLRQANYQNAQQMALQDIQNNMQGQLANQQSGIGDINRELQASLANQSAGLQGAQQRLSAANQLGQLSNLGFGMGQQVNQNLAAQGAMQQALQQMVMDQAQGKFNAYANHPAAGLPYLNAALGASNLGENTSTLSKQPGLFDYLTLGASGYTGGT